MSLFGPSDGKQPANHTRRAYQGIRKMLFHGEIVPGQKIGYRDLAERLGMSQTPVIQALKWLEFQGIVRHEPNRGYYTEPVSIAEVEEIYRLREVLECDLLAGGAGRLDDAALARLEEAAQHHAQAAEQVYLYDRLVRDMNFHLALAQLADRPITVQMLRILFDRLYLKYGASLLFATSMTQAAADHRRLLDALKAGDIQAACRQLRAHIGRVREHVVRGLQRLRDERDGLVV